MYDLLINIPSPDDGLLDVTRNLKDGLNVTATYTGLTEGGLHTVKFVGTRKELTVVARRFVNSISGDINDLMTLVERISLIEYNVTSVSDAATRVRQYLKQFATLGGNDPEVIHVANHKQLLVSDITLLLDALGRDR